MEGAQTTRLFANCSMDMITDLLMVNGLDSLVVIVNQGLTKGVILIPCSKMITAEQGGCSPYGQSIQTVRTTKQDYL